MKYVLIFILNLPALCFATPTVWQILRAEFKLDHQIYRPEVQREIQWIQNHPSYVEKACQKSEPYIYYIAWEIKHKNLPGELALLPMIESAYNPFSSSNKGAAGLWQIMSATGKDYGLTQDKWQDGRRGIQASTRAALQHLAYLRDFFKGTWPLAIAAYNAGQGKVSKAQSYPNQSFWELDLPQETKNYVPRFLALAEVMSHPDYYHIKLPEIPYTPYFTEVSVGKDMNLPKAAKMAGISYKELMQLNPSFKDNKTTPGQNARLLIPAQKITEFGFNLARKDAPALPKLSVKEPEKRRVIHIVQTNDSYYNLERMYKVSVREIQHWNHLAPNEPLHLGQELLIWKAVG